MIPETIITEMTKHLKQQPVDIFQNEYKTDTNNLENIKKDVKSYEVIDYMNESMGYELKYRDLDNIKNACCSTKMINDFRDSIKTLRITKQKNKLDKLIDDGLTICPRCGGSGRHSYNKKTGSVCFKCNGVGAVEKVMK